MIDLEYVLQTNSDKTILVNGENEFVQHKESMSDDVKIIKTMAGMANNKGGYILIGVDDQRKILGLNAKKFADMQNSNFPGRVTEYFAPQIIWNCWVCEELNLGIIKVEESINKPVISIKNNNSANVKECEIYYSYKSSVERIKYPELQEIIQEIKEEVRTQQDNKYKELFGKISMFGIDNTGVLNNNTVETSKVNFIIDDEMLSKLKRQVEFIESGKFTESGKPTLKLIGDIQKTEQVNVIREIEKDFEYSDVDDFNIAIFNEAVFNYERYIKDWFDVKELDKKRNICVFSLKDKIKDQNIKQSKFFTNNYQYRYNYLNQEIAKNQTDIKNTNSEMFEVLKNEIESSKNNVNTLNNVSNHCYMNRLKNKITNNDLFDLTQMIIDANINVKSKSLFRKLITFADYLKVFGEKNEI